MHWTLLHLVLLSCLLHLGFLAYGAYQDTHPVVKFTDVDYLVFSDGANFIANGQSPYLRATYRYTPLLAWLLLPNVYLHPIWGKILFCAADIFVGWVIYDILIARGLSVSRSCKYSAIWLLNPFIIAISTRGNAESIIAASTLAILWALVVCKNRHLAAVFFGIAVHLKIYPIIYALPLVLFLDENFTNARMVRAENRTPEQMRSIYTFISSLFRKERIEFGLLSGATFFLLTGWMYASYGKEFLDETYLYHITRKDHRHNFSHYFYHMYLSSANASSNSSSATWLHRFTSLISFAPQLGLVSILGAVLAKDLTVAIFAQTFAFVMLNKVCTSQYFVWYLCLLPLILPSSRLTDDKRRLGVVLILLWVMGQLRQAFWLFFAFQLEHMAQNTFRELWGAGSVFYLINSIILASILKYHRYEPIYDSGRVRPIFQDKTGAGKKTAIGARTTLKTNPQANTDAADTTQSYPSHRILSQKEGKLVLDEIIYSPGMVEMMVKESAALFQVADYCFIVFLGLAAASPFISCAFQANCFNDSGVPGRVWANLPVLAIITAIFCLFMYMKLTRIREDGPVFNSRRSSESLLVIESMGLQLQTTNGWGTIKTRFVPFSSIGNLIINEAVTLYTIRYYLAILVEDDEEMTVVFEVSRRRSGFYFMS
ncbi:PIG-M-domain-containing protein [Phlyctochytrium arcticum]|nr:PIG-M-domain-containing protein [Phlyctochytrium arcticum]